MIATWNLFVIAFVACAVRGIAHRDKSTDGTSAASENDQLQLPDLPTRFLQPMPQDQGNENAEDARFRQTNMDAYLINLPAAVRRANCGIF